MKTSSPPKLIAILVLGLMAPLSGQNFNGNPSLVDSPLRPDGVVPRFASTVPGSYEVPSIPRAQGQVSEDPAVFASQNSSTLDSKAEASRTLDAVADLGVLRDPSPYRKILVNTQGRPYEISEDSLRKGLAMMSALYRESGKSEKSSDCTAIALSVQQRVTIDPSQVLEIVEREVGANPACACEIVKTAITASEADTEQVVAIVRVAIHASPESMRMVSQCAIAANPESIAGVQALLAKLDPNAGVAASSAKSAKSGKDAKVASVVAPELPNPLDRPPPPIYPPPPIFPPFVSDMDPCVPLF